jgi:putative Holliday junction resolvase
MVEMGMKKKDRQKKGMIDEIAATIILQEYLNFAS